MSTATPTLGCAPSASHTAATCDQPRFAGEDDLDAEVKSTPKAARRGTLAAIRGNRAIVLDLLAEGANSGGLRPRASAPSGQCAAVGTYRDVRRYTHIRSSITL